MLLGLAALEVQAACSENISTGRGKISHHPPTRLYTFLSLVHIQLTKHHSAENGSSERAKDEAGPFHLPPNTLLIRGQIFPVCRGTSKIWQGARTGEGTPQGQTG